jgi:hypothetical protein
MDQGISTDGRAEPTFDLPTPDEPNPNWVSRGDTEKVAYLHIKQLWRAIFFGD